MRREPGSLPIRGWLALALALTFAVPAVVTVVVGMTQFGAAWHTSAGAADIIRNGSAHWSSPAWQAATRRSLHPAGVDFVLVERRPHDLPQHPGPFPRDGGQ